MVMFQSLIGILGNCNFLAAIPQIWQYLFQSLIGILGNCNESVDFEFIEKSGFNP